MAAREEAGLTSIELLVVVVILGVPIALATPLYTNYKMRPNDKAAQSDLRNVVSVLEECVSYNGSYPTGVTTKTPGGAGTSLRINVSGKMPAAPCTSPPRAARRVIRPSDLCWERRNGGTAERRNGGTIVTTAGSAGV